MRIRLEKRLTPSRFMLVATPVASVLLTMALGAVIFHGMLSEARPIRGVTVDEIGLLMGGAHGQAGKEPSHAHPA